MDSFWELNDTIWMEKWNTNGSISATNYTGTTILNDTYEVSIGRILGAGIPIMVLFVLIGLGNSLVILSVALTPQLRSTTNMFIVNLAVADLLLGLTVLPFSGVKEISRRWFFGAIFCEIWLSMDVLYCTSSIQTLCVISIDRYIGVSRPLHHGSIITQKRSVIIIAGVWVVSLCISLAPYALQWRIVQQPNECEVNTDFWFSVFSAAGSFYIPTAIILGLYMQIFRAATRQASMIRGGQARAGSMAMRVHRRQTLGDELVDASRRLKAKFDDQHRAAKTLAVVVGVYLLCWSPFFVLLPIQAHCRGCIPELPFQILFWLGYCNSLMNPIIYAVNSRAFRNSFRLLLHCRRPGPHSSALSPTQYHNVKKLLSRSNSPKITTPIRTPLRTPITETTISLASPPSNVSLQHYHRQTSLPHAKMTAMKSKAPIRRDYRGHSAGPTSNGRTSITANGVRFATAATSPASSQVFDGSTLQLAETIAFADDDESRSSEDAELAASTTVLEQRRHTTPLNFSHFRSADSIW